MYIRVLLSKKSPDVVVASTHPKTKQTKYFRMEDIPSEVDPSIKKSVATEVSIINIEDYEVLYETGKSFY